MFAATAVAAEILISAAACIWVIYNFPPLSHEEYASSYALRPPPRLIGRMFHLSALVFFVIIAIADIEHSHGSCFLYYTFWNFIIQTAYWIWALIDPKRMSRARCALLDVILPTCMAMTIVVWTILYPIYGKELMTLVSWTQHGGNLVLFLIEFVCSDVRFVPWNTCALVAAWSTLYAIFGWVVHSITGTWMYPFLAVDDPSAPLWYFCLLTLHLACFGIVGVLAAVKVFIADRIPMDDGSSLRLLPLRSS
ncbi:Aste57867_5861 [Aphanomyces stellatus]|uniref:Aste57867_5861 protein n=1 Tax=Aphanomyces stellatus TaxID=120398 RepID=A0A485KF65_9STRA|nr:hypothetical protein As57867_005847 [Aphanomyces stellatus]VFT82884.1 Aste57867_5861 [Aphanomyces stellatus]